MLTVVKASSISAIGRGPVCRRELFLLLDDFRGVLLDRLPPFRDQFLGRIDLACRPCLADASLVSPVASAVYMAAMAVSAA